jgi:hypothetical protein
MRLHGGPEWQPGVALSHDEDGANGELARLAGKPIPERSGLQAARLDDEIKAWEVTVWDF